MKKVFVGIIGCGGFGNFHLDNLLKMDDVQVVALAASNKERLKNTGKKVPNAHLYEDYHDMFEQEKLDAVIICVTPARHEDIEALACQHHVHFYVEKPIGVCIDTINQTAKLVKESGIITSVGYQERYNPALTEVKDYIKNAPVGLAYGSWIDSMPSPLWWRTKEASGGQMVEQTTHIFDSMRYLFGEAKSVYATAQHQEFPNAMEHDVEDYSTAVVTFENGVIATVCSGCYATDDGAKQVGFTLLTQNAKVEYNWSNTLTYTTKAQTTTKNISGSHHFTSLKTFIEAVSTNDPSLIRSSYSDGARSCELTLLANESLKTGKVINL